MRTFYRRNLPTPPAIAFSSESGKEMFKEALDHGLMAGYFKLAEQFLTQAEPSYCGLTTLTMVLNTLSVDPGHIWKGAWRWYSEDMLDCCLPLETIKNKGITFDYLICLGKCNSLIMDAKRPSLNEIDLEAILPSISHKYTKIPDCCIDSVYPLNKGSIDDFRADIIKSCCSPDELILIVSYTRKKLEQTGDGHFSPIAGYHSENDMVLIMDVARYKYPPHWIAVEKLFEAMCEIDKESGKTRGWILCSKKIDDKNGKELMPMFFKWYVDCSCKNSRNFFFLPYAEKALETIGKIRNGIYHLTNETVSPSEYVQKAIECVLECLPNDFYNCIRTQCEPSASELNNQYQLNKERIIKGIHNNEVYKLLKNSELCELKGISLSSNDFILESVTVILLVLLKDDSVNPSGESSTNVKFLESITSIDNSEYPELCNDVKGLYHQFITMQAHAQNQ